MLLTRRNRASPIGSRQVTEASDRATTSKLKNYYHLSPKLKVHLDAPNEVIIIYTFIGVKRKFKSHETNKNKKFFGK
jgi:hypothetical protein